ncbi:penicillin-binding protein 1C [Taibaiella koreensis]|uniref:penicillin-binding protein 1C n=1 Tax=Taibaiella koreensis TaxID=1268548 RepID=UPI000E59D2D1|nr:penicillin-binding protein 1C [Taibaiella koreensis]
MSLHIRQRLKRLRNRLTRKSFLKRGFHIVLALCSLFALLDVLFPLKPTPEYAPLVRAADGTPLYMFLTRDQQWRMFTTLDEITPELRQAIVFKEDKYFYRHAGINPLAVIRAGWNNLFRLKRTSGASTITMQVARLLSPKKRSYGNKLIEMFRALQLEGHYNKDEILQLYLNLVPYGSNIQGVKAASLLYFGKTPDQLSLAELTALSVIPNRPNSLVIGKDNNRILAVRNKWLERFGAAGLFAPDVIRDALAEPLDAYRHNPPRTAPQMALRLRRAYPGVLDITATIDAGLQRKAEELAAQYVSALKLHQIHNAAVIVIDNRDRQVKGYIGSSDFFDKEHHGQVDGVQALRSPGSALKPLLYGLAFDKGLATPKTVINDVPIDMKGYTPENYDLDFRGKVTVEEALRQSLNIPAVKLLNALGTPVFINELHAAGFRSVWDSRKKLGLSMILGGCGVQLDEMAALYCTFAHEGLYRPLQWRIDKQSNSARHTDTLRLLSPGANYMLSQILSELRRPDLPNNFANAANIPHVAWKTGTSYGRRDAWSIGYNQRYTIAVWIGNFSGQGAPDLNGAGTATPLLFQLFGAIDRNGNEEWRPAPTDLAYRLVCTESGKVPGDYCTTTLSDTYLPGISDNAPCRHLKEVYLSADETFAYCTSCLPPTGYKIKSFPDIDPELASFYESRHIAYDKVPEHNPACSRYFEGRAPVINSLTGGATYLITDKGKQQLQLSCAAGSDVHTVYWYINDRYLGRCTKEEKLFFIPADNNIKVSCTDDKGRNSDLQIRVKFI